MSVIQDAIYHKMVQDSHLVSLVSSLGTERVWDPVENQWKIQSQPAIFMYEPIPQLDSNKSGKALAWITVPGHVSDSWLSPFRSKTRKARDLTVDIRCHYKEDQDISTKDSTYDEVEAIAERVFELFHEQSLPMESPVDPHYSTWEAVMVNCDGPIVVQGYEEKTLFQKGIDQMVVTLHLTVQEVK